MDTRSNESITSKKEYIYKVCYYKQVAEEFYSLKDEMEAENLALDVFEDDGLDRENGDFFKIEFTECLWCSEKATKMNGNEDEFYCDDCYKAYFEQEEQNND